MITITQTKDHQLIAALNEEAQNLHAKLHPELFKPFNGQEMEKALESYVTDPNCRVYMASKDGVAIGYVLFFIREVKENAFHYTLKSLYIDQISVLSSHRKTGAGKLLMEQAEIIARENGIHKIELDHWSANTAAAAYFRKNGYKLYKERLYKMIG